MPVASPVDSVCHVTPAGVDHEQRLGHERAASVGATVPTQGRQAGAVYRGSEQAPVWDATALVERRQYQSITDHTYELLLEAAKKQPALQTPNMSTDSNFLRTPSSMRSYINARVTSASSAPRIST